MTLISTGALDRAETEIEGGDVAGLIQRIHQLVQATLTQHEAGGESDDGMELGVCYLPNQQGKLFYAGARFDLFEVNNGDVQIIKGTKKGIGYRHIPFTQEYVTHEIEVTSSKSFYMTSDGLIDQVGGERNRMFGKKRFKELLNSVQDRTMSEQKERICQALLDYQGEEKRRDDVAMIGFQVR